MFLRISLSTLACLFAVATIFASDRPDPGDYAPGGCEYEKIHGINQGTYTPQDHLRWDPSEKHGTTTPPGDGKDDSRARD